MKQRLIDANEVLLTKDERILGYTDINAALKLQMMKIVNAPTIEAIPIKWMKNYARRICADDGGRYNSKAYGIDRMIYDWEKENAI